MNISMPHPAELKQQLQAAQRAVQVRTFLLVVPLLVFLVLSFLAPIGVVLYKSINDDVMPSLMPQSAAALSSWDPATSALPPLGVRDLVAREIKAATLAQEISRVATRANFERPGMRSLLMSTSRRLAVVEGDPSYQNLLSADPRWGETGPWAGLKHISSAYTFHYYLNALDLRVTDDGSLASQPDDLKLYRDVAWRTLSISFQVTALTLLLGFPLAYLLASLPSRTSNLLMVFVLLPFWTSLLVRTMAWVVILQPEGLINSTLMGLHLTDEPLPLIFNRFGVVVAMVHILMPYMVLTLYSVMKSVPTGYVRAARSLGASPLFAFLHVYLPQTYPGVFAGSLLVFILALGFYITPAIVGGGQDQMLSFFIADHMNNSLNWGLAAALSGLLLMGVFMLYGIYARLTMRQGAK